MQETDTGVMDMGIIKKLTKRQACKDCLASYHMTMVGEDQKKYIVPIKIKYCPKCGRRVNDARH